MKSLILFLLLLTTNSFAQDDEAGKILKEVSAKYKSFTSLKAEFNFLIENQSQNTKDTQKGTLYVKGNNYKLEITGQEIMSDGKTIWTYLKDANELQINDANAKDDAINPSTIFTLYEKGFQHKMAEAKTESEKTVAVDLNPDDKTKPYYLVRLTIDKTNKTITGVKVFSKNGNRVTYTILKLSPNIEMDNSLFAFDKSKHAGVEVIDLR